MELRNWFFTLRGGALCGDTPSGLYVTGIKVFTAKRVDDGHYDVATNGGECYRLSLDTMDRYFVNNHLATQKEWLQRFFTH